MQTVPCFIREQVNQAMGHTMPVKAEGEDMYYFALEKLKHKTRIYGAEYNQFLEDYDMQPYDVVSMKFSSSKKYLKMEPFANYGCTKERLPEEYDYKNEASVVVYSRGVTPTLKEKSNINRMTVDRGFGLGPLFVHSLTDTDINQYGLRIPKLIVSKLDIPPSGSATLICGNNGAAKLVEYYPTTDERLCFNSGWIKFAEDNTLNVGMMVLIMFHIVEEKLEILVDVVGN